MKVTTLRKTSVRVLALVIAASAAGLGCELIVDFDRTLIPTEGADSGGTVPDSSIDVAVPDTSTPDAADAQPDAPETSTPDADAADDAPDGD